MIKLIPGTENVAISSNGEFYRVNGSDKTPFTPRLRIGAYETSAELTLYGIKDYYGVNWLVALALTEMDIPSAMDNVDFYTAVLPNGVTTYRTYFRTPVYYDESKTYRIIPGYSSTAVNRDGTRFILVNNPGNVLPVKIDDNGIKTVQMYDPLIQAGRNIRVELLVALAWVYNPDPWFLHCVRHKDKDVTNNEFTNLYWCTFDNKRNESGNDPGNDSRTKPCKLRDIVTGEVRTFPSAAAALRFIGYHRSMLHHAKLLEDPKFHRLINGRYEIRTLKDKRPWMFENVVNISPVEKLVQYVFIVTDPSNTSVAINGVLQLRNKYKLWNSGCSANKLVAAFREKYPDHSIHVIDLHGSSAIEVRDITTRVVTEYPTLKEAAEFFNVTVPHVLKMVHSNGRSLFNDKYQIRYRSADPWPAKPIVVDRFTFDKVTVEATNVETGEVSVFESLTKAGQSLGIDRHTIQRYAASNKAKKGYTFKLVKSRPVE